jgi:hypothetical protein
MTTVRLNNEILNKVTTLTKIEKTTKSEIIKKAIIEYYDIHSKDLIPFKIITSQALTTCHIDLIHKDVKLDKWHQDTWLPFVRISNSFNRTLAL